MAVEYLLNPRSTSHIHHNKPGMAYEIWRLVNSAEGPYAHIKKNFHDKRVIAWIKFCIDALIKKNVLVQEEDTYRSLRLSDDYLEQQTQDFSLDESVEKDLNLSDKETLVKDEILDLLSRARNNECWIISLPISIIDNLNKKGISITTDDFKIALEKLIDTGYIERIERLNNMDMPVIITRLSNNYIERETTDFNLDESKIKKNPRYIIHGEYDDDITFNENAVRDDILKWVVTYGDDNIDESDIVTCIFNDWPLIEDLNDYTNPLIEKTRDYLLKLIDKMIDDGIFEKSQYQSWDVIKISPSYYENETKDFNLDEARYFNVENDEYDFDEQAIIDLIIKEVKWRMIHGPNLSINGYVRFIGDRISPYSGITSHATPCKEFAFLCIKKLLKQNVLTEKPNVNGANVIMLSDEYLEHETENFTLDESVDNGADKNRFFVFDGKGRIHFDEEKSRARIFNSTADFMTSDTLASINDIIMDVFDEYHNETVNWPFAASCAAEDYFAALIVKMEKEGILTIDSDRNVRINDDYLDAETENFTLDEVYSLNESEYFLYTAKDGLVFDEDAVRNLIINTISTERPPHADGIWYECDLKLEIEHIFFGNRRCSHQNKFKECSKYIKNLIDDMVDEGILISENNGYEPSNAITISVDYLEKETSDFNLDI